MTTYSGDAPYPMTYEQAVTLAREIAASLGGEQARAIEVLMRFAARAHRRSSMRISAVADVAMGAQHFVKAQEEIAAGLQEVRRASGAFAAVELEEQVVEDD